MDNYDHEFNLRRKHPFGRVHLIANQLQSAWARATMTCHLDIAYGPTTGQTVDIFPAAQPNAPVLLFIHGGYFRALDKNQYSYIARPYVSAGFTVGVINYDLAPSVSITEIIEQNLAGFEWLKENIHHWNGDSRRIVLCGHSVGAYLVAKITQNAVKNGKGECICAQVLLSGIFDLTKVQKSYLNDVLSVTESEIEASPIFVDCFQQPETLILVGGSETAEFIRQSERYHQKMLACKTRSEYHCAESLNHYTVSRLLASRRNFLHHKIGDFTR
ncbi:alpha/beta hydrolase [Vibrio aquimaris]|uniref:Phenmedipham hydrolase n=1 Tax=Vibrio aquimaris TaxID=2587862 RepID=A0A5P9CHD9_9VIBR|nr:alpha/beta hydrolase [Vibrio aquimaris]QFT25690.1 Phenmedipham hydrolase [Vibrio aquimaris]